MPYSREKAKAVYRNLGQAWDMEIKRLEALEEDCKRGHRTQIKTVGGEPHMIEEKLTPERCRKEGAKIKKALRRITDRRGHIQALYDVEAPWPPR